MDHLEIALGCARATSAALREANLTAGAIEGLVLIRLLGDAAELTVRIEALAAAREIDRKPVPHA